MNPPQGINFSSETIPASELARVLCRTASFIQEIEPSGNSLLKFDDWWEHDGLHFPQGTITFHELFENVKSPRSLLQAMSGDEDVFVGIISNSESWYLRFYLSWDDEGYELSGRYDVTLPAFLAADYLSRMQDTVKLEEQDATTYYNNIRL